AQGSRRQGSAAAAARHRCHRHASKLSACGADGSKRGAPSGQTTARLPETMRGPLRHLLRQPSKTIPAIALVALAVGVGTALFANLGALLWPRVDGPRGGRVVALYVGTAADPRLPATFREFELLREQHPGLETVAASTALGLSVGDGEETRFAWAFAVSGRYFDTFLARPLRGRLLQEADDRPGAPAVAVLHPAFWRSQLGGDPAVVGRPLLLNGRQTTIVGVAPEGFIGHGRGAAIYVPLARIDELSGTQRLGDLQSFFLQLVGRASDGWTLPRVAAALAPAARAADAESPHDGSASSGPRRIDVVR